VQNFFWKLFYIQQAFMASKEGDALSTELRGHLKDHSNFFNYLLKIE